MAKTTITMELPKVGDILLRCMTPYACDGKYLYIPMKCTVTYVNKKHRWYKVKFLDFDVEECYGLPAFDHSVIDRSIVKNSGIPIICWETGNVYSTIIECANDMGIDYSNISLQLAGIYEQVKGYHFSSIV